jgi:hypothetical protein
LTRAAAAVVLVCSLCGLASPARAHSGPPFPIVNEMRAGAYAVSVWTDPDTTDDGSPGGQFWITLTDVRTGEAVAGVRAVVTATLVELGPGKRGNEPGEPVPTAEATAHPTDDRRTQFAAVTLTREGRYRIDVRLDGTLGKAAVAADVDATYDLRPSPAVALIYAMPFVLVGLLWVKRLMRSRAQRGGHKPRRAQA